jgi:predicted  nucleic acid-binding Zn-ribbon protein
MEGTEEEKSIAAETIEGLREEVRVLNIELAAVKQSRDRFQSEVAELKKQCESQQRQLKKLKAM